MGEPRKIGFGVAKRCRPRFVPQAMFLRALERAKRYGFNLDDFPLTWDVGDIMRYITNLENIHANREL